MVIKDFPKKEHEELWVLSASRNPIVLGTREECVQYAMEHYSLRASDSDTTSCSWAIQMDVDEPLDFDILFEERGSPVERAIQKRRAQYVGMLMDKLEELEASRATWEERYNRMVAVVSYRDTWSDEADREYKLL